MDASKVSDEDTLWAVAYLVFGVAFTLSNKGETPNHVADFAYGMAQRLTNDINNRNRGASSRRSKQ